ncbi:single-stranded DNA-binding protein [Virgibacillus siamensis]|uniref:single-stranded DNA-binding protein n=1 Tax=Virgibacillus siamensis TaxID=480071 RepID=UPI0009870A87|nr:single-stranded DNA-binding protein [Virgibacillus siamensis]
MINNTTLVGRLTKDCDLRYSQNGKAIANFNLAVNRQFKNQNGEREADFINIVQFGKGAEVTAQYVGKGSQVGVTGRIQTRNYENNEGKRIYVTEVVAEQVAFLDSKGDNKPKQEQKPFGGAEEVDMNDSLPF